MTYTSTLVEVKKLAALNSAVDQPGGGSRTPAEVFYSKTAKKNGKRWTPKHNQCFWCLEVGHRIADCPNKKKGEQAKTRPDGVEICGLYFNMLHGYLLVSRLYVKQMIRL